MASHRAACRVSLAASPLRKPTLRAPKVHPATGLPLSRAKGQHILHNVGVLRKMLEAAGVQSVDSVFEVGCGTGELTMQLLRRARLVHTVEIEPRMAEEAKNRAEAEGFSNLEVTCGDVLRTPMPRRFDVCVSNLPYKISSPFIFQLLRRLAEGSPWRSAVLMLQREYAEKLLADPGEKDFSRLALNVRLFARTVRICDVRPGSFVPAPQVHSTVVRLEPRLPTPRIDFREWDALIRIVFSRRRKTLRAQFKRLSVLNMLEQNYKIRCSFVNAMPARCPFPELVNSVLEEEGMVRDRAFAMDIDDLYSLLQAFHRKGIYFNNVQGDIAAGDEAVLTDGEDDDGGHSSPHFAADALSSGEGSPLALHRAMPPPPPPVLQPGLQIAGNASAYGAGRTWPGGLRYP